MPNVPKNSIGIKPAFIVNNRSYKYPKYVTKKAAMLHSTATPGAPAKRFTEIWNSDSANCSTEFVLDDKDIFMMMPIGKNGANCIKSWHCGACGNNTHVACEVCEPLEAQMIPVNFQTQGIGAKYPRKYSITRIQMELIALGYLGKGECDGSFGPRTADAVKRFQKKNGLEADGLVGRGTLKVLQARPGSYAEYDAVSAAPFFNAAYDNAVKLYGFICDYIGTTPDKILCHSEGHTRGIASNHADVMHWFPYHGKSMDTFRKDVDKWRKGTYVPLSGGGSAQQQAPVVDVYVTNIGKLVNAGIINSPDYWTGIKTTADVRNNYVMALLRQMGVYFCKKSHVYGAEAMEHACNIDAKWWAKSNGDVSVADVRSLYIHIAEGVSGRHVNFDEAIHTCLMANIINSPDYWLNLKSSDKPSANCVKALLRQAGAYFASRSYIYAIDCLEDVVNMASAQYWRNGSYTIDDVHTIVNTVSACL